MSKRKSKKIELKAGLNMASLACVLIAGYLALHGMEGWGWFLFLALLLA